MLLVHRLHVTSLHCTAIRQFFFARSYGCGCVQRSGVLTQRTLSPVPVIQCRFVRHKGPKDEDGAHEKTTDDDKNKTHEEFSKKVETEFRRRMEEYAKQNNIDPKLVNVYSRSIDVKKMARNVLLVWLVIGSIVSVVVIQLLTGAFSPNQGTEFETFANAPHVSYETFINKFLPTGEVQRIVHFVNRNKAVIFLHNNAIIDGQPARDRVFTVELNRPELIDPFKFRDEVRRVESNLGISFANGVRIDEFQEKSLIKFIELALGLAILSWLGFQYGRLFRRSFNSWKNGAGKKTGNGGV